MESMTRLLASLTLHVHCLEAAIERHANDPKLTDFPYLRTEAEKITDDLRHLYNLEVWNRDNPDDAA